MEKIEDCHILWAKYSISTKLFGRKVSFSTCMRASFKIRFRPNEKRSGSHVLAFIYNCTSTFS